MAKLVKKQSLTVSVPTTIYMYEIMAGSRALGGDESKSSIVDRIMISSRQELAPIFDIDGIPYTAKYLENLGREEMSTYFLIKPYLNDVELNELNKKMGFSEYDIDLVTKLYEEISNLWKE